MNENHPDFIGPRRPTFIDMVRQLGYLPKADSSRPVGVTPEEWFAAHTPKPACVRACERRPWECGQIIGSVGFEATDHGHAKAIVDASDIAITRMLTGKLPEGAGANTAVASFLFTLLHEQGAGDGNHAAKLIRKGITYTAVPYRLGLHEIRQRNRAGKAH